MTSSSVQSDRKIRKAEKQQLQVFLFFCPPPAAIQTVSQMLETLQPQNSKFESRQISLNRCSYYSVHPRLRASKLQQLNTRALTRARTHTGCGQNIMNTNTQLKKGLKVCESQKTSDHEKITNHKNNPERKIQFIKFHQSLSARICL